MKILVADDDPKLNQLVCDALREAGYQPDPVLSASEVRKKINAKDYDLILLDWMFDGEKINGIDLSQEIAKTKRIPILMLTGKSALADRVAGLGAGASDYLIKPFYLPELIARVQALLRRRGVNFSPDKEVTIGALTFYPITFEVKIHGKRINLCKKEFGILHALVDLKGKTLSRSLLGKHVWGKESALASNAIDVHVNSLRDKLGKYSEIVETVRGVGYRLSSNFKI